MFKYSDSNKRYHTLDYFYKHKFGGKVAKISLNAGFTCPNKDGTKGVGGCVYCSKLGSGDYAGNINKSLKEQFFDIKDIMDKKWPNTRYIGYFQANTNTYAPVRVLKEKYEEILKIDGVIGLNIATRSDAITDECLDYLEELSKKTYLTIELGLQTIHEKTNILINRQESLEEFKKMVLKLRSRGINVIIHIINGLPYETKQDMIETIKYVSTLDIQGIKIHMLFIEKNTKLAELYEKEKFHVLTKDEYIDIVCDQLELLNENVVIHRITGDPKKELLIEPKWLLKKFVVLNDIDKEMLRRDSYQGKYYNKK
jgi:radical SAM protein (TIGR01212 family)